MNIEIYKPNWKLYIGVPILVFISCYLITLTTTFKNHSETLSYGILADLLITSPLIYFFIIRKSSISKTTIIRVLLLGILVSGFILDSEKYTIINTLKKWVSPIIELFVILFIIKKFRKLNSEAKLNNTNSVDFLFHCREVLGNLFGNQKIGNIIASEVSMVYYAFARKSAKNKNHQFTSYKESGVLAILYALLMVLVIETIAMHFVFTMVGPVFAWVLTGLSLYTCLQFFAHIRAVKLRPITIANHTLNLHMGLAADASINIDNIKTIKLTTHDYADNDLIKISLFQKLEGHNIRIKLHEPVEVIKILGLRKESKTILFFADTPNELYNTVMVLKNNSIN